MRKIWLRNIKTFALVDDDDYDWVSVYSWYGYKKPTDKRHYVRAGVYQGKDSMGKSVYHAFHLHRLIADAAEGETVTFRNRNALDCRRENLVKATRRQIRARAEKRISDTGFIGVSQNDSGRYQARICVNYESISLGFYSTAKRAALAYDAGARKHNGEFAALNFPSVDAYSDVEENRIKYFAQRKKNTAKCSKYLGVSKSLSRWQAQLMHEGVYYELGSYSSEREAALAFDKKARELRGNDAILNFPRVTNYEGIERKSGSVKPNRKTTSRFIGVSWAAPVNKWSAQVTYKRVIHHLGYFADEAEAARARDAKALELRGTAAILNFPQPLPKTKADEQDYQQLKAAYCFED